MIKAKERKTKKYISLMMVPYDSSKIRSIKISSFYLKITLVLLLIATALISVGIYIDKALLENDALKDDIDALYELNLEQSKLIVEQDELMEESDEAIEALQEQLDNKDKLIVSRIDELFDKYQIIADKYIDGRISSSITSRSNNKSDITAFADDVKELKSLLLDLKEIAASEEDEKLDLTSSTAKLEEYLDSIPITWPLDGNVRDEFGWRIHPIKKVKLFHDGIDIGAAYYTEIYASGAGTVTYSGYYGGYGNTVIIDHGYGLTSLYAHCNKLIVKRGASVEQGDLIAQVGSTGSSTGPHCHFEIRLNGKAVDPAKFLD